MDAGHHLEQLASDVRRTSAASRCHIDLAGVGLGVSDEFRNGLDRNRRIHLHHVGHAVDAGNRRYIAYEIVVQLFVKRRIGCVSHRNQEKRVAVCGRAHDRFGGDVAVRARPVLDNELLTEPLRQPLTDQTRGDVGPSGRSIADDDAHRPRRIDLRPCDTRHCRKRASACGQMQKLPTGKCHGILPNASVMRCGRIRLWIHGTCGYSGLMLAERITLAHFSISSAMNLPNSAGELANTVAPRSASRALTLGLAITTFVSVLSLSMMLAGVFLGATSPYHPLAS